MSRNRGADRGGFLSVARVALDGTNPVSLGALPGQRWRIFTTTVQVYIDYDRSAAATSIPIPISSDTEFGDGTFSALRLSLFSATAATILIECYEA